MFFVFNLCTSILSGSSIRVLILKCIYFRKDDQDSAGKKSAKKKMKRNIEAVCTHSFKIKISWYLFVTLYYTIGCTGWDGVVVVFGYIDSCRVGSQNCLGELNVSILAHWIWNHDYRLSLTYNYWWTWRHRDLSWPRSSALKPRNPTSFLQLFPWTVSSTRPATTQ